MLKVQSTNYAALHDAVFPPYFLFCASVNLNNMGQRVNRVGLYSFMHQPSPCKAVTVTTLYYSVDSPKYWNELDDDNNNSNSSNIYRILDVIPSDVTTGKLLICCCLQVLPEYQAQISQQARTKEPKSAISRIFSRYDVVETSYHFLSQRIDLHLCDDPGGERQLL